MNKRPLAIFVVFAGVCLLVTAAQAQSYTLAPRDGAAPPPLYPYAAAGNRTYAVEVAPHTYAIETTGPARVYPYVGCTVCVPLATPRRERARRTVEQTPAKRSHAKIKTAPEKAQAKVETKADTKAETKDKPAIVREKPVVRETKRYVDDPPRVIEREVVVDDRPVIATPRGLIHNNTIPAPVRRSPRASVAPELSADDMKKRTIAADAEVTIMGPDRMSIRLFRKGHKPDASASED